MEIENYKIIELSNNINEYYQELLELKGAKFNYALLENIKLLNIEITRIQDLLKSEKHNEYQNKRIELCEKYSEKDDNNNPIKIKNSDGLEEFHISDENKKEFENKIQTLQNDYKTVIENYRKQIDIYNEKLNETVDIPFKKIDIDNIPNDISFKLMQAISIFIS